MTVIAGGGANPLTTEPQIDMADGVVFVGPSSTTSYTAVAPAANTAGVEVYMIGIDTGTLTLQNSSGGGAYAIAAAGFAAPPGKFIVPAGVGLHFNNPSAGTFTGAYKVLS